MNDSLKSNKIIILSGGSLYIGLESFDLEKDFIYSEFLEAYIDKKALQDDYFFSELTETKFGITSQDERYKELKNKILGLSD